MGLVGAYAASQHKILDLLDLTGDGFDEIPTERWNDSSMSVYSSKSNDVPCLFCIAIMRRPTRNLLVDLSWVHPNLVYRKLESGKLFLQTACWAPTPTGAGIMRDLPQRTLAAFRWEESIDTFVGPSKGPQNTWIVLDLDN